MEKKSHLIKLTFGINLINLKSTVFNSTESPMKIFPSTGDFKNIPPPKALVEQMLDMD